MDALSRRARTWLAAALLCCGSAALTPAPVNAAHAGCFVVGEVQGLDTVRTCTYVAATPAQWVYVGTPYAWRVWVLRHDSSGEPVDVTLASGTGPVAGPPPEVHPATGETVNVTMTFGCSGPYCGTIGFLAAGLEQGHP